MRILVINSGSSSIRYGLFDAAGKVDGGKRLAGGTIERVTGHRRGLEDVIGALAASDALGPGEVPAAIGHRVVHGGARFSEAVVIDEDVIGAIEHAARLAPLHNPANLAGIEVCRAKWPGVPQVAVFDTAFHQTMPPVAYRYAVPKAWYENFGVRRYGFHGISHQYLTREAARLLAKDVREVNLITMHLGNGASVTAVRGGKSVDTSMGMTPLEGLVMGTRSGDIDPAIPAYLVREGAETLEGVDTALNTQSGLKGLCGVTDVREARRLEADNDPDARLALALLSYRLRKYVCSYFSVLGEVDALVFSGGVGENHPWLWDELCRGLSPFGVDIDPDLITHSDLPLDVAACGSRSRVLVIATDEESEILRQVKQTLGDSEDC